MRRFSSYVGCDHGTVGWIVVEHDDGRCEKVEWAQGSPIPSEVAAFHEGVRIILADRVHDAIYGDTQNDVLKEVWEYLRSPVMIVTGTVH
jgi:hypothetical protein